MKRSRIWLIVLGSCLLVAGLSNGLMDSLQFHYHESIPGRNGWNAEFWNPQHSWRYKYARDAHNRLQSAPDNWYYNTFNLSYKERFPLSATALAWTTDAWHLAKTLAWGALRFALVFVLVGFYRQAYSAAGPVWKWAVVLAGLWLLLTGWQAVGFHLLYSWL